MPEKVTKTDANPVDTTLDSDPRPTRRRGRPKGSTNKPRLTGVKDGLMGYVAMVGTTLSLFPRTQLDGQVVLQNGEPLVDSLVELAKSDKRVAKALTLMVTGGAWTGVIIASANIALPIAANHGLLPGFLAPMFAPDISDIEASNNGNGEETTIFTMKARDNG